MSSKFNMVTAVYDGVRPAGKEKRVPGHDDAVAALVRRALPIVVPCIRYMTAQMAARAPDRFASVRAPFEADAELVAQAHLAASKARTAAILTGDDDLILSGFPCLFFNGMRGKHRYTIHSSAEEVCLLNFDLEAKRRSRVAADGKPDIVDIYAKHGWPAIIVYSLLHRNDFAYTKGVADVRLCKAINAVDNDRPLTVRSVVAVLSKNHGVDSAELVSAARVSYTHLFMQPTWTWSAPRYLSAPDLTYPDIWEGLPPPDAFDVDGAFSGCDAEVLRRFARGEIEADGAPSPLWSCASAVIIADAVVHQVLGQIGQRFALFRQNSVHIGPLRDAQKLSVKQLTDMLRSHGGRLHGDKATLIQRLLGAAQRWQDRSVWSFVTAAVDAHMTEAEFMVAEKDAKRHLENAEAYADFLSRQSSGGPLLLHDDVILSHAGDQGADTLRQEQRSVTTINDMQMEQHAGNLRIVCHTPTPNGLRNYVIAGDVPPSMARQAPYTTLVALTSTADNVVVGLRKTLCFGDDDGRQCRSFHMCVHARVVLALVQRHMPAVPGSTDGERQWAMKPLAPAASSTITAAEASAKSLGISCSTTTETAPFLPLHRWSTHSSRVAPHFPGVLQVGKLQASGRKREVNRAKREWAIAALTMVEAVEASEPIAAKQSDLRQE